MTGVDDGYFEVSPIVHYHHISFESEELESARLENELA
jgi:hypothetical protein